jgi:hypothetical protein
METNAMTKPFVLSYVVLAAEPHKCGLAKYMILAFHVELRYNHLHVVDR